MVRSTLAISAVYILAVLLITHAAVSAQSHLRGENGDIATPSYFSRSSENNREIKSIHHTFREAATGLLAHENIIKEMRLLPIQMHTVIFVVRQKNIDKLTDILHDISDPASNNYGKHMTNQEIADLTTIPESRDEVVSYLKAAGVSIVSETLHGEYITATAPVGVWEQMFNTEFFSYALYPHQNNGDYSDKQNFIKKYIRSEEYSVPNALHAHVESVLNTVQMPSLKARKPLPPTGPAPSIPSTPSTPSNKLSEFKSTRIHYVTPAMLNAAYNIDSNVGYYKATQSVFESANQSFSPADLTTHQKIFSLPIVPVNHSIGGHSNISAVCYDTSNCDEGNLDVQYIMAISQYSSTTYSYTDLDLFSTWLLQVAHTGHPPLVISISYGDDESDVSPSEFEAFNTQAIKLSAMGVTLVVASGDDGVASYKARDTPKYCSYMPDFPASSPYVIAVGATQGVETGTAEIACQSNKGGVVTSGGGFSTYYPQPSWQASAVSGYFAAVKGTLLAPVGGFNAGGRGYPDISAAGVNYVVVVGGQLSMISGTSASTPVVAGMISLVNAARLKAGMSSVGWVNPILYANYKLFTNDITSGKNNCAASSDVINCCTQGFSATTGWDPTTGLGSLNFKAFKTFMMNISSPAPTATPSSSPSSSPSTTPTSSPTATPTSSFTFTPTATPPLFPTSKTSSSTPTAAPTAKPTATPTTVLTVTPTAVPTATPTAQPTVKPTAKPTIKPTVKLTSKPSFTPSSSPSIKPTIRPSVTPTRIPTASPSVAPSVKSPPPSVTPSVQ